MTEDGVRSRRDRASERQKKGSPLPFVLIGLVVVGAVVGFFVMQALDDGSAEPKPAAGTPPAQGTGAAVTTKIDDDSTVKPEVRPPTVGGKLALRNAVDGETRAGVELATSGVAVVDPKEPRKFVELLVAENGDFRLGAEALDLDALTKELLTYSMLKRDLDHPMQPSLTPLLITVDRRVRWREIQWAMQAGAHPDVRIWRIYFAAKTPDGELGVLPAFLPIDRGLARAPHEEVPKLTMELKRTKTEKVTRVKFLDQEIGVDEQGFRAATQRIRQVAKAMDKKFPAEINAWAWVPFEDVVRAVTIFREAGIETITFIGAPPPGPK